MAAPGQADMLPKEVVEKLITNQREVIKEITEAMQKSLEAPLKIVSDYMANTGTQMVPEDFINNLIRAQREIIRENSEAAQRSLEAPLQILNGLNDRGSDGWGANSRFRSHRSPNRDFDRNRTPGPFQYPQYPNFPSLSVPRF